MQQETTCVRPEEDVEDFADALPPEKEADPVDFMDEADADD